MYTPDSYVVGATRSVQDSIQARRRWFNSGLPSYASPEHQEAAKDFIRWFAKEETQREWGLLGGYTCNKNVLASDEFLQVTPFNAAFAETMNIVMDYWNISQFGQLLEVTQRELSSYIVGGEGAAEEAMNTMAEEHHAILVENGVISE